LDNSIQSVLYNRIGTQYDSTSEITTEGEAKVPILPKMALSDRKNFCFLFCRLVLKNFADSIDKPKYLNSLTQSTGFEFIQIFTALNECLDPILMQQVLQF
jgi:hypothetical protein